MKVEEIKLALENNRKTSLRFSLLDDIDKISRKYYANENEVDSLFSKLKGLIKTNLDLLNQSKSLADKGQKQALDLGLKDDTFSQVSTFTDGEIKRYQQLKNKLQ